MSRRSSYCSTEKRWKYQCIVTWRLIRWRGVVRGADTGRVIATPVSRHKHFILFSLNMPVLPVQWYVGVGPACLLDTPARTIWALIQMITVACCCKVSTNHISNIQYSRRHKNVMNVMWRSCESLGWTQCHWPGQNPETRCDMLIHTRESIHIHVKTELVTIRNILVRLLE